MSEKKTIKVQNILADLEAGMTRKEIKDKYELSLKDLKTVFQHPKLKNKKTKSTGVILIDDDDLQEANNDAAPLPASEESNIEVTEELPDNLR